MAPALRLIPGEKKDPCTKCYRYNSGCFVSARSSMFNLCGCECHAVAPQPQRSQSQDGIVRAFHLAAGVPLVRLAWDRDTGYLSP